MYRLPKLRMIALIAALVMGCSPNPPEGNRSTENQAAAKVVVHKTKELITFRGVPFGKPGVKEALMKLCLEGAKGSTWLESGIQKKCGTVVGYGSYDGLFDYGMSLSFGSLGESFIYYHLGDGEELRRLKVWGEEGRDFSSIVVVLTERYGPPKTSTTTVSNRFGSEFTNYIYSWVDDEGTSLVVETIDHKIGQGKVVFRSAADVREQEARVKANIEAAKAKL